MSKVFVRITGVDSTVANVNKMLEQVKLKTLGGLMEGAEYIHKDILLTPPVVPKRTGKLEESWVAKPYSYSKIKPIVEAGFDIDYAIYVHENMDPTINWTKINSGPKFLELGLKRNTQEVVDVVAAHIAIKK